MGDYDWKMRAYLLLIGFIQRFQFSILYEQQQKKEFGILSGKINFGKNFVRNIKTILTRVLSFGIEFFPLFLKESSVSSSYQLKNICQKFLRRFVLNALFTLPNPQGTGFLPPLLSSGTKFFPGRNFPKVNFPGENPPPVMNN